MRKLTAGLFMSVDGVVADPYQFQFDSFDEELGGELGSIFTRVDTVVLGRIGYSEWSEYWPVPEHDDPFGAFINPVKKYVASRTLTGDLAWENSELIRGDLVEFIRELKNSEGGDISLMGGISLVRELLFSGDLDELTLITHPVVAGDGRHLFEPTDPTTRLEFLGSTTTSRGNALLRYRLLT